MDLPNVEQDSEVLVRDYENCLYSNGLPYDKKLQENIASLDKRVFDNFASMLILDGGVGHGKTTLAVEVADSVNKIHGLGKIDFSKQLAMGAADFLRKLRICFEEELPVIIYTEAGDFNKRGSLTKLNAILNRTFETFRAFKILVILDLPSFHVLDNDLLDKQIPRLLLHVSTRQSTYGNYQGYSLYRMMYIKAKMGKLIVKPFAYELVDANFRGHFLNLPKDRAKLLDKVSIKGKLKILRKSEIEASGLVNYNMLASKIEMSPRWIKAAIKKLKIKHERVIDHAKYFPDTIVNRLIDYAESHGEKRQGWHK
jgi:hypothetical protein